MKIEITPDQVSRLEALCALIEGTPPLERDEAKAKREAWFATFTDKILDGQTFGEASGGPTFLNQPDADFRLFIRSAANDIEFHTQQTKEWLEGHWRNGDVIAPHYPKRVAIILRKAGRVDLEVRFLRALSRHMQGFVVERLPKAVALERRGD